MMKMIETWTRMERERKRRRKEKQIKTIKIDYRIQLVLIL